MSLLEESFFQKRSVVIIFRSSTIWPTRSEIGTKPTCVSFLALFRYAQDPLFSHSGNPCGCTVTNVLVRQSYFFCKPAGKLTAKNRSVCPKANSLGRAQLMHQLRNEIKFAKTIKRHCLNWSHWSTAKNKKSHTSKQKSADMLIVGLEKMGLFSNEYHQRFCTSGLFAYLLLNKCNSWNVKICKKHVFLAIWNQYIHCSKRKVQNFLQCFLWNPHWHCRKLICPELSLNDLLLFVGLRKALGMTWVQLHFWFTGTGIV